jgi:cytochrome P450
MPVDFDPYSHRWKRDPYRIYRELRDHAPVHYSAKSDAYTISRHADVQHVLTTPEVFSSNTRQRQQLLLASSPLRRLQIGLRFMRRMRVGPRALMESRMLIQSDGEVHSRMRKLVNRGFTPRRITAWEERVRQLAREGLARLRALGEFDLVEELAMPLPVTVIAELLGIESERMRDFKRWSDAIVQSGTGSGLDSGDFARGPGFQAMTELRRYLRPICRERRARPGDDLISLLVTSEGEAALSDFEVYLFVLLLLVAGNETTTNLLGNAVEALLDHPDQLERVRADLSLVPGLVEEVLRYDGPVQFINRTATRDSELHGVRIPEGAHLVVLLGSANRDERRFPDPDRLDVSRDTRGHVGFGFGAHFCLGAALARLEARSALEVLVPELPRLVRVLPEPDFLDSYLIRGRAQLPLRAAA